MSIDDLFLTIYDNFRQSRGRFILTLSGITLGVALLIIVGSFLSSAEQTFLVTNQEATDASLITVSPAPLLEKDRQKTSKPLDQSDALAVRRSTEFSQAMTGTESRLVSEARSRHLTKNVSFSGVSIEAIDLYKLEIAEGRFFTFQDFKQCRAVCIIGEEVRSYFQQEAASLLEEVLTIEGTQFRIVGILKKKLFLGKTSDLTLWDRRVIVPLTTFRAYVKPTTAIDFLFVRIPSSSGKVSNVALAKITLERLLLRRHYNVPTFQLRSAGDQEDVIGELMAMVIRVLFIGIASLALLVGGINIMNIMLITVTERTREIGIRRALGCTQRTLLLQFLLEAGITSLIGGIIGIVLGLTFNYLLAIALKAGWGNWVLTIDHFSIIAGLAVSFMTGIVFGYYPARKATQLTPEQCLRYE